MTTRCCSLGRSCRAIAAAAPEFDPGIADLVAGRALGPAFVNRLRDRAGRPGSPDGGRDRRCPPAGQRVDLQRPDAPARAAPADRPGSHGCSMGSAAAPAAAQARRTPRGAAGIRSRFHRGREPRLCSSRCRDDHSRRRRLQALQVRTEGWAAGLQLAGISLQRVPDADPFIDHFTGSDRLIADYLAEEVLDDLEPDVRRFLLQHVGAWNGSTPICATPSRGRRTVQRCWICWHAARCSSCSRMPRASGFATTTCSPICCATGSAFRPGEEPRLRRRAAQWLLDHGHFADAVEQFLAAGEPLRVAELIIDARAGVVRARGSRDARPLARGRPQHRSDVAARRSRSICSLPRWRRSRPARQSRRTGDCGVEPTCPTETRPRRQPSTRASGWTICRRPRSSRLRRPPCGLLKATDDIVIDFVGVGGRDSVEFLAGCMVAVALLFDGDLDRSAAQFEAVGDLPGAQYRVWKIYALGGLRSGARTGRARERGALERDGRAGSRRSQRHRPPSQSGVRAFRAGEGRARPTRSEHGRSSPGRVGDAGADDRACRERGHSAAFSRSSAPRSARWPGCSP